MSFDKFARDGLSQLQGTIDGVVSNSEYRPTIAAAVADFATGTYFVSDDRDGVTAHPNEKRRYQVTAVSPFWVDRGRFVDKADVGLPEADNTSDAAKAESGPIADAIESSTDALAQITEFALADIQSVPLVTTFSTNINKVGRTI